MGIFGPSLDEIWSQLATEIGADYIKGGFAKSARVETKLKEWDIILDTYTVSNGKTSTTYTRMRLPFYNLEGLKFKIYRKGIFSNLGKALGMQDIPVGFEDFDEQHIIKGNNEDRIRILFADEILRYLIQDQPAIELEIKESKGIFEKPLPEKVNLLTFTVVGVIKDIERLKKVYLLFSKIMEVLVAMGIASEEGPEVTLK